MNLRRLGAAAALAALTVSATPAAAAPATRALTVVGSGNTYMDVTMPATFRLYRDAFERGTPPKFSGKGDYVGVLIESLRQPGLSAGTVLMRGMPGWDRFPLGIGTTSLPAGRYRVHLLGKGAVSVRIAVTGLRRDLTLRPSKDKRTRVSARLVHRTVAAGVTPPVDRTLIPITVRRMTTTVVAAAQESTNVVADQQICVRPADAKRPCELGGSAGGGGFMRVGTPSSGGMGYAALMYPGDLPVGKANVEYQDTIVGVPGSMWAFALTIN